jgi:hypothetical protein
MQETDFWAGDAEFLELSIEGQRLIISEITDVMRTLWGHTMQSFDVVLRGAGRHQQSPPA